MKIFTCPMHPEVRSKKPGNCPKCGMKLILETDDADRVSHNNSESYKPLIVVLVLISLVTLAISFKDIQLGIFSLEKTMSCFMAGFFLVFSGFKFMDLKGFADGYSTYDLLAKKIFSYGYIYPFIELALGISYILVPNSQILNLFTFFLMTFSGIGVAIKISKKQQIHCSCLGTFLKVPLSKVTLIEDFGMATMALLMFLF